MSDHIPIPTLHVLLIGVGKYHDKSKHPALPGAERDVEAVEQCFLATFGSHRDLKIIKLSTRSEREDEQPTSARILECLNLLSKAKPGDEIWIHYSGHGMRRPTKHPTLKRAGHDEALVGSDGEPIWDTEVQKKIRNILVSKSHLNVFFDCCHSGSATRSADTDSGIRSLEGDYDGTLDETSAFDYTGLGEEFEHYQFFGACHASEVAREIYDRPETSITSQSSKKIGVFTRAFVDCMQEASGQLNSLSYGMLMSGLKQKMSDIRDRHPNVDQTPVFFGGVNQVLCGGGAELEFGTQSSVPVQSFTETKATVCAGQVNGVRTGNKYELFKWPWCGQPEGQGLAMIRIEEVGRDTAIGVFTDSMSKARSSTKLVAILRVNTAKILLVRCPKRANDLEKIIDRRRHTSPISFVDKKQKYTILVDENDHYYLEDEPAFPHSSDPAIFLESLEHLARYETRWDELRRPQSWLRLKVDGLKSTNVDGREGILKYKLCFNNNYRKRLYLTMLNFTPYLGIEVLFPKYSGDCAEIEPGSSTTIEDICSDFLESHPPHARDRYRALVTDKPLDLSGLRMGSLIRNRRGELEEVDCYRGGETDSNTSDQSSLVESEVASEDGNNLCYILHNLGIEGDGARGWRQAPPSVWGTQDLMVYKDTNKNGVSLRHRLVDKSRKGLAALNAFRLAGKSGRRENSQAGAINH